MTRKLFDRPRTPIRHLLAGTTAQGQVAVGGWARTVRRGKEVTFIALNDGSCLANLQLVLEPSLPHYEQLAKASTGACLLATGELVPSPAPGQPWELKVCQAQLLGDADADYPLQKKRHSFEYLRTIAHLRPRSNTFGAVFRMRSALAFAVHRFFQERGFLYVQTPIITASDCEGAGEMFRVTTLPPADPPRTEKG